MVYKEKALSENGKKFIDYILSEEGQKIVSEEGLISVK
ncbi:phosphate ABC transporter, phosphate-binding domain protein [[Clostridium] sordellii ATCC 9714]|nr:phosphate ABC transporter, phosphate-binding domain protein [[Clostridium] sordellii ATCC 9714] [Paeniclostridium sordellii ATCC 9714]